MWPGACTAAPNMDACPAICITWCGPLPCRGDVHGSPPPVLGNPSADALTPEILRELDSSRSRGEAPGADAAGAPVSKLVAAGGPGGEDPRDLAPMIIMDD